MTSATSSPRTRAAVSLEPAPDLCTVCREPAHYPEALDTCRECEEFVHPERCTADYDVDQDGEHVRTTALCKRCRPARCSEDCEAAATHACMDCSRPFCDEHATAIDGTDGHEHWCWTCRAAHSRAVHEQNKRIEARIAAERARR